MTKGNKKQKAIRVSEDMPVINHNAGGIDVGAAEIWVSIPPGRDPEPIRRFEMFTRDLYAMADWLKERGINSVAMESTGVYWIPVFQILERRGIGVALVNARYAKKCHWAQKRLVGLSVAANPAHVWIAGWVVSTGSGNRSFRFVSAASADID